MGVLLPFSCSRLAVITCLLLCVAAALTWTRSYWRHDSIGIGAFNEADRSHTGYTLHSSRGRVLLVMNRQWYPDQEPFRLAQQRNAVSVERRGRLTRYSDHRPLNLSVHYRGRPPKVRHGFMWNHRVYMTAAGNRELEYRGVMVPYWFLALLITAVPAAWAGQRLRRLLRTHGHSTRGLCPACGYDLRATPGRCPECGTEMGAPVPAPAPARATADDAMDLLR